jgi:CHRD domain
MRLHASVTSWLIRGLLLSLPLAAAACGDDNSPTSPSATPLVFTAQLQAGNEIPAVSQAEQTAHGAVQITMTPTRDSSNNITAVTAKFEIQLAGLPTNTTFVGGHIHPAPAGVTGPVIINTGLSSGTPPVYQSDTATWTFDNINVPLPFFNAIVANPSNFYFNVHSFSNPGGVARGQLGRTL